MKTDYWYIELYEDCPCERQEQLTQREGQVIREIGTLNKRIKGWTDKEYREDNKDKFQEYRKEYNKVHKDKIQEYNSEHIFCDCGCSVSRNNILRHKRTSQNQEIMEELAKKEILGEQIWKN